MSDCLSKLVRLAGEANRLCGGSKLLSRQFPWGTADSCHSGHLAPSTIFFGVLVTGHSCDDSPPLPLLCSVGTPFLWWLHRALVLGEGPGVDMGVASTLKSSILAKGAKGSAEPIVVTKANTPSSRCNHMFRLVVCLTRGFLCSRRLYEEVVLVRGISKFRLSILNGPTSAVTNRFISINFPLVLLCFVSNNIPVFDTETYGVPKRTAFQRRNLGIHRLFV